MPFVEEFSRSWVCNTTGVTEPSFCFGLLGDNAIECYNGYCLDTNQTHPNPQTSHRFLQECVCHPGWVDGKRFC